jgi:hypothetical protein
MILAMAASVAVVTALNDCIQPWLPVGSVAYGVIGSLITMRFGLHRKWMAVSLPVVPAVASVVGGCESAPYRVAVAGLAFTAWMLGVAIVGSIGPIQRWDVSMLFRRARIRARTQRRPGHDLHRPRDP